MTYSLKRLRRRTIDVLIYGDTNTIRVLMAVASLLFAVIIVWPGDTAFLKRDAWRGMRDALSPSTWSIMFTLHFLGVSWRQVDERPRPLIAFVINAYGLLLWYMMAGLNTTSIGEVNPGNALEITILIAASIALVRTGLNDEKVTP